MLHEMRPALTEGATGMNRIPKANVAELALALLQGTHGSPVGSRSLNLKTSLTSRDGGI